MQANMNLSKKGFQTLVRDRVAAFKIPYIEAVMIVCDELSLPPEDVSRYVDGELKQNIEAEARKLKMLKPLMETDVTEIGE
jgi:hypothetical protein